MERKSVLLVGATGLVGGASLRRLSGDPSIGRVVVLSRRPLPPDLSSSMDATKIEEHVVDFDGLAAHLHLLGVDQVVCALGTTRKRAGSKERFRQVDLEYPLTLARMGIERGAGHFLLVSAIGASASSWFFYNRVKGELEDAIRALPYRSVTIIRPSLLLGDRPERRPAEEIARRLGFLAPARYSPVHAEAVAAALVEAAREDAPGHRIIESVDIPRRE